VRVSLRTQPRLVGSSRPRLDHTAAPGPGSRSTSPCVHRLAAVGAAQVCSAWARRSSSPHTAGPRSRRSSPAGSPWNPSTSPTGTPFLALAGRHDISDIVHLAGSLPDEDPVCLFRTETTGLRGELDAARTWGVRRFAVASSIGVYAGRTETRWHEELALPTAALPHLIVAFKKALRPRLGDRRPDLDEVHRRPLPTRRGAGRRAPRARSTDHGLRHPAPWRRARPRRRTPARELANVRCISTVVRIRRAVVTLGHALRDRSWPVRGGAVAVLVAPGRGYDPPHEVRAADLRR